MKAHTDAAFAVSSPCGRQWWEAVGVYVGILHGRGLECTEEAALSGGQSAAEIGRCAVGLVHDIGAYCLVHEAQRALGSIIMNKAAAGTVGACAGCGKRAAGLKTTRRKVRKPCR